MFDKNTLRSREQAALHIGAKASQLLLKKLGKFKKLYTKKDHSLVTEVDRASERLILNFLRKSFPQDSFRGEESGTFLDPNAQFCWHIDPLDGTTNFVHGLPLFCVSIGLEWIPQQKPVLGAIFVPTTGDCFFASYGKGAFQNKKRIHVSNTSRLQDALLCTGFSASRKSYFEQDMNALKALTKKAHGIRRTGTAALDLCYVAAGVFDGFWESGLSSWDVIAGLTLIAEAGGEISQFNGKKFHVESPTLLTSNGRLHRQILTTLKQNFSTLN